MTRTSVAVTLLLALPSSTFAQSGTMARFRERMEHKSILENFDPTRFPLDLQAALSCDASRVQGRTDAEEQHESRGWFRRGIFAGLLIPFGYGVGVITATAAFTKPQPQTVTAGVDENCYRDGYQSKAKNKNVMSSLKGSLIGTAAGFALYFAGMALAFAAS